MKNNQISISDYRLEQTAQKLRYEAPVIIELEIIHLVQSATNVMSESNSGYYS